MTDTYLIHISASLMKILGWQCVGLIAIIVWTAVISGLMFGVLRLFGILRVCDEAQEKGEMVAFNNKLHQQYFRINKFYNTMPLMLYMKSYEETLSFKSKNCKVFEIASAFLVLLSIRYNLDLKVNYIGSSYCYDISYMLC